MTKTAEKVRIIGITGGTGAGKSEAARRFVATSRHIIERAIGTILFGLGIALATASLQIA